MPTKPNPVTDLPPLWGGAGNYAADVYPPTLPWGAPHPQAGQPVPWGGQPRLNSTGLTAFANNGLTPQQPTPASPMNEVVRRLCIWPNQWVSKGTSAADPDAHIMETDLSGNSAAVAYVSTSGFLGPASSAAILPFGFDVPDSQTSDFGDNTVLNFGTDSSILADSGGRFEIGTVQLLTGAPPPTADGELTAGTNGIVLFRSFGSTRYAFGGTQGPWVEEDADQVPETVLAVTTFVTTSSKLNVNGLLRIRVTGEMQRSVAGACAISIQQDQGNGTWVDIDNGGITTKNVTTVDTSDANRWTVFQIERTFGTGVTDTFFRLRVSGSGNTAKIRDTHLTVRRLGA